MKLHPYDDHRAFKVFEALDPYDLLEASVLRGEDGMSHLHLFAEWRNASMASAISLVLCDDRRASAPPFAVLNVAHTGAAGVAQAAFLARNHKTFARPIARAAALIKEAMPQEAIALGINRIEARSWAKHPTAATFLTYCGFRQEAEHMRGFGSTGLETCHLFAWTL